MTDTSWLEVDLFSLRQNMQTWRSIMRAGADVHRAPARLCAVIKADAYGLGAGEIGRCLDHAGVDMLAVYSPGQADDLLAHPITRPILILMPVRTRPETVRLQNALFTGQLHLTVDSPDQLLAVHAIGASYGVEIPVHLSLDTGLSRGGLCPDQLASILRRMPRLRHVQLAGIFTHFASAESDPQFTAEQFARFTAAIDANRKRIPRNVILHAAATHAALRNPKYHLHMARIGLGLLGYAPTRCDSPADTCAINCPPLRPAIRWRSRLIHVRRYPAGSTVGYNCTTRLTRDSYLGLIPVGYADGLPLSLSNRGTVGIIPNSARRNDLGASTPIAAPILGRVNMDQIIVDLTPGESAAGRGSRNITNTLFTGSSERPASSTAAAAASASFGSAPLAQVGDLVDLISPDPASPCSLPNIANDAQTSCYEILCRISPRVPRLYANTAPSPVLVASDRLRVAVG